MTPAQYQAALHQLGLSHKTAALFLGIGWRQSYRFATGDRPVPKAIALTLTLTISNDLFPEQAEMLLAPERDQRPRRQA